MTQIRQLSHPAQCDITVRAGKQASKQASKQSDKQSINIPTCSQPTLRFPSALTAQLRFLQTLFTYRVMRWLDPPTKQVHTCCGWAMRVTPCMATQDRFLLKTPAAQKLPCSPIGGHSQAISCAGPRHYMPFKSRDTPPKAAVNSGWAG